MNITALKHKLGIDLLELSYLTDEKGDRQIDPTTGKETKWLKHWDNDNRQAILMHEDTVNLVKKDPENVNNLGLKTPIVKQGQGGEYVMHVVVNYTAPDMTL